MDYRPNADAVTWFAHEVFPRVRSRRGNAQFWIVGARPSVAVRRLAKLPGVHVTGKVPDVRPYLAHAACVVAPLRIARGVQNKVLEAFAMARPVVASPPAAEGLRVIHGKELLIASGAAEFADAVCSIAERTSPELGRRARAFVETDHDWAANLEILDALCRPDQGAVSTAQGIARVAVL
jgi:glycosyltransferase involved in cell wall biosynthesis